jgi:hypothetical protein
MKTLDRTLSALRTFGFDLLTLKHCLGGLPRYIADYRRFKAAADGETRAILRASHPIIGEGGSQRAQLGHYFWQDLLVAQKIIAANPARHVDVGSRLDGFVAHLAATRNVDVFDIRPAEIAIPNVTFTACDMMNPLPAALCSCTDSLSCLHALEHFGLGRYGDPIDPNGHLKGLKNLAAMLKKNGTLYLSVPLGKPGIEFNAHRIFSWKQLQTIVSRDFTISELTVIDEHDRTVTQQDPSDYPSERHTYACAILTLIKR